MRVTHVQAIAGACVVRVVKRIITLEAVVRGVIDSFKRKNGSEMMTFRSMTIYYVEDHL